MLIVHDLGTLHPGTAYWVPAIEAPIRDWAGLAGCHRGSRYLISAESLSPAHDGFPAFESRAECLRWIMEHQRTIAEHAPDAHVHAARLDAWILGLDAI